MNKSQKVLVELKFWLSETLNYKEGMKKSSKDSVEIDTLIKVIEKIDEIEKMI